MRRLIACLFVFSLATFACNIPGSTTPSPGTQAPVNTAPVPTLQPPAATDTQGPPPTNATCGPLSLYLDPAIATSYDCQTIPEAADLEMPPFGINPQYSKLTLAGYPLADRFMTPHIDVFPVQRYHELLPDLVDPRVAALQALTGGGAPGAATLPLLPIFNAAQMFYAQYAVVPFQNGSGIRYVTMYGQAYYPANNHDVFFSFQGLTSDGLYWISLILPISHPSLPENGDNPPGGYEEFNKNAEAYFVQIATQLNGQPPESFAPSITALDALILSITIQP
jgi:hypothetical protein